MINELDKWKSDHLYFSVKVADCVLRQQFAETQTAFEKELDEFYSVVNDSSERQVLQFFRLQ